MGNGKPKCVIIGAGYVGTHCGLDFMQQKKVVERVFLDKDEEKAAGAVRGLHSDHEGGWAAASGFWF